MRLRQRRNRVHQILLDAHHIDQHTARLEQADVRLDPLDRRLGIQADDDQIGLRQGLVVCHAVQRARAHRVLRDRPRAVPAVDPAVGVGAHCLGHRAAHQAQSNDHYI